MSKKRNFAQAGISFSTENIDELEQGVEQATATAEGAQATAEAAAAEVQSHEQDPNAHGGAEGTADAPAAAAAQAEAAAPPAAGAGEAAADDAGEAVEATETTTETVEEAAADIQEADEETLETEEQVAAMDQATDRTEDVIEAVNEADPADEEAGAEISSTVAMANESMKRFLGSRFQSSMLTTLSSNESFSMKSPKLRGMYKGLALEALEETKTGFFTRMKEALIRFWDWIKARLAKLVTWFRGAAKEREKLLAAAREANITTRAVVDNATLAQYLTVGNQVEDAPLTLKKALDDLGDLLKDHYARANDFVKGVTGYDGERAAKGLLKTLPLAYVGKPQQLLGGYTFSVTSGDISIADTKEGVMAGVLESISGVDVKIERDGKPAKARVTTLTTSDIVTLFGAAADFEKDVLESSEAKSARAVSGNWIGQAIAKFLSKQEDREFGERVLLRTLSRLSSVLLNPMAKLISIANQANSTVNLLAKISIKTAKGESTEADLKEGEGASNVKPFDPKADRSFSARKEGAEDIKFKDVATEDYTDPAEGDDPLQLNPPAEAGDADLNQSSQPAAEAPGKQDAAMKETDLDLPDEPQVSAALEQYEEFVDGVQDGVDGLDLTERTIEVAEGAQGKSGLDEAGAELMSIASEAIHSKFMGLEKIDLGFGVESFRSSAYKLRATNMSVESWKEKGKEIGAKIVEMVKNLGKMIRYLWKQFLTLFKGLEGKYERINRKLATTQESAMKNGKAFESGSLSINGKAISAQALGSALTAATKIANDVASDALDLAEIASYQAQGNTAEAGRKTQEFVRGSKLSKNSDVKTSKEDGKTIYRFEELPGGRAMVFGRPDMEGGLVAGFTASIEKGDAKEVKAKAMNLNKSEAKNVMRSVRGGLDSIKQLDQDVNAVVKSVDEIVSKLDPAKLEGQEGAAATRKAIGALGKVALNDTKVAIQGLRMLIEVGLNFVAKSIGMKGSEAAATGKDGKPSSAPQLSGPSAGGEAAAAA